MESHGSVVTHLLSQVKLGMDLTKVVLPTFILERRSLLEMYADFFAHPDLLGNLNFVNVPSLNLTFLRNSLKNCGFHRATRQDSASCSLVFVRLSRWKTL